jgi:hypothetical protein
VLGMGWSEHGVRFAWTWYVLVMHWAGIGMGWSWVGLGICSSEKELDCSLCKLLMHWSGLALVGCLCCAVHRPN